MKGWFLFAAGLASLAAIVPARADCTDLPEPAKAYLQANPEWHLMTLGGWDKDSIAEWHKLNKDACPGLATANLDGKGPSYALLLQRQTTGKKEKKLISVQRRPNGLTSKLLETMTGSAVDFVVRANPGKYKDAYGRHSYVLNHEGFVAGSWGSAASAYYISNGHVKTFLTSD